MPTQVWSRHDIRNTLLAIYAAKLADLSSLAGEEASAETLLARSYRWGCRAATQLLLVAFGLPLDSLEPATSQRPSPSPVVTGRRHWWLEDIERLVAGIYHAAITQPAGEPDTVEGYRRGFSDLIEAFLIAVGSQESTLRWRQDTGWEPQPVYPDLPEERSDMHVVGRMEDEPAAPARRRRPPSAARPPQPALPSPPADAESPARCGKGRPAARTGKKSAVKSRPG